MQTKLIAAVLLAASAACAHAETWTFQYTGFVYKEGGVYDPNATVTGSFTGSDIDGDGVIVLDELSALTVLDRPYLQGCLRLNDFYRRCAIEKFSYRLTGKLDAKLRWWGSDGIAGSWGSGMTTGEEAYTFSSSPWNNYMATYQWTDETAFEITPAPLPVPEPAMATLLSAGLLALAGYGRRLKGKGRRGGRAAKDGSRALVLSASCSISSRFLAI